MIGGRDHGMPPNVVDRAHHAAHPLWADSRARSDPRAGYVRVRKSSHSCRTRRPISRMRPRRSPIWARACADRSHAPEGPRDGSASRPRSTDPPTDWTRQEARFRTPRRNLPLAPSTCRNRTSRIESGTGRDRQPNRAPARAASPEFDWKSGPIRPIAAVTAISRAPSRSTSLSRRSRRPNNDTADFRRRACRARPE